MQLSFNEKNCKDCNKKCLENCPNNLKEITAFACKHCSIEKAACYLACKQKAIFEITQGILSIDKESCNNCGACLQACKEKAISIVFGKAKKCDLCAERNFSISCIQACEKKSILAILDNKEEKEISQLVGWRKIKIEENKKNKTLKENELFEIIELRGGEKKYLIKGIPNLSLQEARLFNCVLADFQSATAKKTKSIAATLEKYCYCNLLDLEEEQKKYLLNLLELTAFKFGPLSCLLENDEIEEIAIIGLGKQKPVFVFERKLGWIATNLYYCNETEIKNLINKMAQKLGRRLTMQTPKLNAVLEDGSRLHAAIEPVSFSGPAVTIRKFKKEPFTPIDLVQNKTISAEAVAFLWMAMQTDCSMLIAGNTGSGKTSTLNALFCFIPKDERIIAVEETPEIRLLHKHFVKLNVVDNLKIGMQQLIIDSLRMRPDRIIVGEIRNNEETLAFIDTLLAGQGKGSYATFHAQSSEETLLRLKSMGVNQLDLASIDLIVVQRRWNKIDKEKATATEQRRVIEISEVLSDINGAKLNCLYWYNNKNNKLEPKNQSEKVLEKIKKCFNLEEKELQKELEKRASFLESQTKEGLKIEEFFEKINRGNILE